MKHSKGPWNIAYKSGIDMEIISPEYGTICKFSGLSHSVELMDECEEQERANAKLVAAAPDLLAALQKALSFEHAIAPSVFSQMVAAVKKAQIHEQENP